jgi:hypothetical protein
MNYLKTHIFYIAIIAMVLISGRVWLQEHDARVLAEQQIKVSEATVKTLQAQIADTQAQADKTIAAIKAKVVIVKTPAQAIAAIPEVSSLPLNSRPAPDGGVTVDAVPLFQTLAQCKEDAVQLNACTVNSKAKDDIITQKDLEITALKKKPGFWTRLKSQGKAAIVGAVMFEGLKIVLGGRL